ncbi:ubiquitin-like protein [Mollisia scopiformis]|uniref:Ubiquitin-like protein n=1 Tax=Mollisia scopiformis TaxID=149040 RepID=A0A194X8B7_MOLSC|nr:ubiquitin-like protein [Mollisia scopiformis]KUJ16418.1 ubiquitin-like protein [Mollisia scopiformis]
MAQSTTGGDPASVPFDSSSSSSQPHSGLPVEMSELDASKRTGAGSQALLNDVSIPTSSPLDSSFPTSSSMSNPATENARPDEQSNAAISTSQASANPLSSSTNDASTNTTAVAASEPASSTIPSITRLDSVAIGPSTEHTPPPAISEAGPVLVITLLLTSGARHPYKIDEKYLTKRNVNVPGVTESGRKDPFSISVYTLKELILREWREEWEAQPSSPSSIRLIYFGRLLDDKTPLKECKFNAESANVVHMTVRPQDIVDEEDATKGKSAGRDRGDGESTAGCRCVIL